MPHKRQYFYRSPKYGRVSRYGITNEPSRRYSDDAHHTYGNTIGILGWTYSSRAAKRAERNQVRSYARRYSRRPWVEGNS